MHEKKKKLLRMFFAGELVLFSLFYLFGPQGLKSIRNLKVENKDLHKQIELLNHDIAELNQQIHFVQTDPFYKEKIAREQLQMARKDEIIYYMIDEKQDLVN